MTAPQPPAARKTAVVQLIVSTPITPDVDSASIAANLRDNAECAERRAAAIEALEGAGWELLARPKTVSCGEGNEDILVCWRKDFADEDSALAEATACDASVDVNFSFGWNYNGQFEAAGMPNCEWWGEA